MSVCFRPKADGRHWQSSATAGQSGQLAATYAAKGGERPHDAVAFHNFQILVDLSSMF